MCKSLSEKLGSTLKLVMLLLLLTNAKNVGAQTGVEDLPAPRIAVKTNLPYWLTLSPNIGAEVGITDHITVDLEGGMNVWEPFRENLKWRHMAGALEGRYWFCERFYGWFVGVHGGYGMYNFSRVPIFMVDGSCTKRYEGTAILGGASVGRSWIINKRFNIEAEIGLGIIHANYKMFDCPECGDFIKEGKKTFFSPTRIAINLIYVIK